MRVLLGVGVLAVAISTGCNGFPKPVPIADAEHKAEKYLTYTGAPAAPLAAGQQHWLLLPGAIVGAPASAFQPVAGTPLLRASWDEPPFDMLYGRGSDGLLHIAAEVR